MELISQGNQSSKNETQVSSSKRTHTFLIVPNYTWGKLHALISEKKSEVSGDVSLFELLRPIPDMYLSDVENDEYINKELNLSYEGKRDRWNGYISLRYLTF